MRQARRAVRAGVPCLLLAGVVVTAVDKGDKMSKKPTLSAQLTDIQVGNQVIAIKTQPVQVSGQAGKGRRRLFGGAGLGAAIGAASGLAVGGIATAASDQAPADMPAQSVQSFSVAVPFTVQVMTSVAVR